MVAIIPIDRRRTKLEAKKYKGKVERSRCLGIGFVLNDKGIVSYSRRNSFVS